MVFFLEAIFVWKIPDIKPRTHWQPKRLRSPSKDKDPFLARMEIPNDFSPPNGCDIISREDRLRPQICHDSDASFRSFLHDLTIWYHMKLPVWYMSHNSVITSEKRCFTLKSLGGF